MTLLDIPRAWKTIKVGDAASVKYGKATPKETGEVPLVGSGGVFGGTAVPLTDGRTLIVGRKGNAGKAWFIEEPCWPTDTTFYMVWKSELVDRRFVYYCLEHAPLSGDHARTTMPSLQREMLEEYPIPCPSLPEQHVIVQTLDAVQTAKEARRRELALERERKASLMKYVFTHGTRGEPTKRTEIGKIPESWNVEPLGAIADLVSGGTPSRENVPWWKGRIPWASPKDMKRVRLSDTEEHVSQEAIEAGSRLVPPHTIFIVIRGMILAKEVPIALTEVPMAFNQDMKAVLPRGGHCPEFLLYALIWRRDGLARHIGTSAHGTRRLSTAAVDSLQMPTPPFDEQVEIVRVFSSCEAKINALEKEFCLHEELFRALLSELLTGHFSALPLIEEHQAQ